MPPQGTPRGFTAMGLFLCFGALMSALAGMTLLWRGTILDRMWALNPTAYQELAPFGTWAGVVFLSMSYALAAAARGWFARRRSGWTLTVLIIATQVVGDLINAYRGNLLRGATGFAIAGALLLYLVSPRTRAVFSPDIPATSR